MSVLKIAFIYRRDYANHNSTSDTIATHIETKLSMFLKVGRRKLSKRSDKVMIWICRNEEVEIEFTMPHAEDETTLVPQQQQITPFSCL